MPIDARSGLATLLLALSITLPVHAQRAASSPAMAERDRLAAEFRATAERVGRRDEMGNLELDRAAYEALAPIACRWALSVAALSPDERRRLRAREGDEHDARAGVDAALVGAARCADPVDGVRVRHALGAPGWAAPLLRATETHRSTATAFEATLPPADAALVSSLRAAQGDLRRLVASRPVELARLVSELTEQRCVPADATLEVLWDGEEAAPNPSGAPPRPFSALICERPFELDFAIAYGLQQPYCDNVDYPRVVFAVHAARGRARVVAELAQSEGGSWTGFQNGERVANVVRSRGAVVFEVQTAAEMGEAIRGHDAAVCSPRTGDCRWVHLADGDAAPSYTLTDTTLTLGGATVTLRDWLAGTGPSLGRAERTPTFPVPFRWAQRNDDGTRNTEAARCTFVVRDPDGTLNVRSEPDQRSHVVGTVPAGAELRAVWVTRSWLRIEQPFAGWIFRGATERRCAR